MSRDFKILSTKTLSAKNNKRLIDSSFELQEHSFICTNSIVQDTTAGLLNALAQQSLTVIFTSANAVNAVAEKLLFQPKWKVFCINGKTQRTIEKLFLKSEVLGSSPTGELLAEQILQHANTLHVVFFSGSKRLHTIPDALLNAGCHLQEIVVYETLYNPVVFDENFDGIVFFSPSGVESFFSVNKISKETVLFSIGPTTTKAIQKYSENIIECAFPSEEEMVSVVKLYYKSEADAE